MPLIPRMPDLPRVDLSLLGAGLDTGDLLLFSGRGPASDLVRLFTRSPWSHIGMVLRLPGHPEPLVLESTTLSTTADIFTGCPVRGIGIVPLADKVREYDGAVAVRRRQGAPLDQARRRFVARVALRLRHRPYRNYVACHLRARLGGTGQRNYAAMFCSELVAEVYRRLGWLPREVVPRNYVPGHFAESSFRLLHGELRPPLLVAAPHPEIRRATAAVRAAEFDCVGG